MKEVESSKASHCVLLSNAAVIEMEIFKIIVGNKAGGLFRIDC